MAGEREERVESAHAKAQEYRRLALRYDRLDEYLERNLDFEAGGHFGFRAGEGPTRSSDVHKQMGQVQKEMRDLVSGREGAQVSRYVWLERIRAYRAGRLAGEFVPMPYQEALIAERIRPAIIQGKNLLLISNTGTGKTTMIKHLGRQLNGQEIDYVSAASASNKLQSAVWGRPGIQVGADGQGGDVFRPGPLTKALTGTGNIFMIDELDRAGFANADMVLKEVYSEHRGGRVTVPGQTEGEATVTVPPKFALVVAINGKRERADDGKTGARRPTQVYNSDGLDASVANQFVNVRLEYPPAQQLYELALSAFIDDKGGIDTLTRDDAGRVLLNLSTAIAEIQESFSSPESGTIQELSFHPGKMMNLFDNWKRARMDGMPFALYLQRRLIQEIDGYATGTIGDKIKAVQILALHDLLPTADIHGEYFTSRELIANADILALIKGAQTAGQKFYLANGYISAREVAEQFSPEGVRATSQGGWSAEGVEVEMAADALAGEAGVQRRTVAGQPIVSAPETPGQQELRARIANFRRVFEPYAVNVLTRKKVLKPKDKKKIEEAFKREFGFMQAAYMNDQLWVEMIGVMAKAVAIGMTFADNTTFNAVGVQIAEFWKKSKTIEELDSKWKFVIENRSESQTLLRVMINAAVELMAGEADETNPDKAVRGRKARELLRTLLEAEVTYNAFARLYDDGYNSTRSKLVDFVIAIYPKDGQAGAALGHIAAYNDIAYNVRRRFSRY